MNNVVDCCYSCKYFIESKMICLTEGNPCRNGCFCGTVGVNCPEDHCDKFVSNEISKLQEENKRLRKTIDKLTIYISHNSCNYCPLESRVCTGGDDSECFIDIKNWAMEDEL